jgi:protein-S-isoprenylcysteine O-methyltransferase Ste14
VKWRWSNVPIPEAHVVGLIVGVLLHVLLPRSLFAGPWPGAVLGGICLVIGAAFAAWAVLSASEMAIDAPDQLLVTGPYAWSRNPMYVGWTCIFLGVALLMNSIWLLALLPLVVLCVHFIDVAREERALAERFGADYTRYRATVRRYLGRRGPTSH